jgi:predicted DNA-binding transcriptional regulator YafY
MPINKDAYIRYRIIDQCLTNSLRKYPTKEQILQKMEELLGPISVSSLEKDFGKMKENFNAPLSYDRIRKGYYYTDPNFSIREFPLTAEEITALDFSTGVLQLLKSTPIFSKMQDAIDKVISGYRVTKILGKTEEEFIQMELPLGNSGGQWIEMMYQAIIYKTTQKVCYQSFNGVAKDHAFSPYLLKEYRNRWYVIGYSQRAEKVIVLAMDRIQEITASNSAWVNTHSFHPQEYFKYSFGITQVNADKPQRVVLSFTREQANYILSQPLHHSQKVILQNEKEVRVELLVYLTQELQMMILGYGQQVKVIAPKKLQENIKLQIKAMNKLYP